MEISGNSACIHPELCAGLLAQTRLALRKVPVPGGLLISGETEVARRRAATRHGPWAEDPLLALAVMAVRSRLKELCQVGNSEGQTQVIRTPEEVWGPTATPGQPPSLRPGWPALEQRLGTGASGPHFWRALVLAVLASA